MTLLIDADACPVKEECYRVAARYELEVRVVANSFMRVPVSETVKLIVVSDGFDAADDWIAGQADARSIVITADILLADRALKADARVLAPNGKAFTAASIGAQIATRAIMQDLRDTVVGGPASGPPPFSKADRSNFLQALDREAVAMSAR
ncbi:MAG: YaiI/YqxD family protein [Alphaproteobacteria bacterium]|nr:YaiI/YqxD family protein [Alphaproteobacteria bacterium]